MQYIRGPGLLGVLNDKVKQCIYLQCRFSWGPRYMRESAAVFVCLLVHLYKYRYLCDSEAPCFPCVSGLNMGSKSAQAPPPPPPPYLVTFQFNDCLFSNSSVKCQTAVNIFFLSFFRRLFELWIPVIVANLRVMDQNNAVMTIMSCVSFRPSHSIHQSTND